jgi:putative ABC transport system permease protein
LLQLLHVRHFRRRPMRAVLAALSLAAGVALAVSILVVQTSVDRSVTAFGRTLAGPAPLRVIGPVSRGGLDAGVVDTIRSVDGLGTAVPLVQAVTLADSPDGGSELVTAIGADCTMEALFGSFGCASPDGPPLVSTTLAERLGPGATLRTDVAEVALDGAPTSSALDAVNRGLVVVYPIPVAQRLFAREGAVDVVYVTPASGTTVDELKGRLNAAVGRHVAVLASTDPPPGLRETMSFMLVLLGMLSVFTLGIGGMLARNTIVLSLVERRRDLAVAAAVGATPRMLTAGILLEVAVLGVAGGLVGAIGGAVLAKPVLAGIDRYASRIIGMHLSVHVTPAVVVTAVVLGVAAGVLATWRPARRAARLDVAAELLGRDTAEEAAAVHHVVRGAALVAVGVAGVVLCRAGASGGGLDPWQPIAVQVGVLVTTVSLIGATGTFAPVAAGLVARLAGGAPGPVRLGLANVARSRRTGVMAVAVAATVGVAFSIASTTTSVREAITSNVTRDTDVVSVNTVPVSNSLNIEGKPWPATVDALRRLPGVAAVQRHWFLAVRQPDGRTIGVVAAEGDRALRLDGGLVRGTADLDRFRRGEIVVGPALARRHRLHPGDRLEIAGRGGVAKVTVQGVEQFGDFGGAFVRMPAEMLTVLFGPQPPQYLTARVEPGHDPGAVAGAIEAAGLQPHLDAHAPAAIADIIADEVAGQIEPFWALQRAMIVVAFVAVLFTLLLSAVQRRRELGVLGAVGMRPGEVAAMVLTEGATVGVAGAVLGSIAAVGFIASMRDATAVVLGFHDPVRFDLAAPLTWGTLCLAVVLVAAAWPAWRAARTEVLPALQYE